MRLNWLKNILPETNSQTTLELRHFLEAGSVLFDPINKYPIWDENHRTELEQKIVDRYYMRQIGFETFGRFKHELNTRMREIMPYYVDLWKTTQFEYNPIENYAMTEEFTDNVKSEGTNNAKSVEKVSDTPQGKIENLQTHLSGATENEGNSSNTGKSDSLHKGWRKGNIGVTTSQQMIQQERDLIINIDVMIIEELEDLFLGVF